MNVKNSRKYEIRHNHPRTSCTKLSHLRIQLEMIYLANLVVNFCFRHYEPGGFTMQTWRKSLHLHLLAIIYMDYLIFIKINNKKKSRRTKKIKSSLAWRLARLRGICSAQAFFSVSPCYLNAWCSKASPVRWFIPMI